MVKRCYLDLFAGFGGWALGAYWAGLRFDAHYFSEIRKYPTQVYGIRFPEAVALGDIRGIKVGELSDGDWYVSGSFPCQSISVAGKREGIRAGNESGLWFEYARIIRELRPKFALVENVGNLTSSGISIVLSDLSEAGYSGVWFDIWASDVGAPHRRERIWIVAYPDSYGREWGSLFTGDEGGASYRAESEGDRSGGTTFVKGSGVGCEVVAGGSSVSHTNGTRQQGLQEGSFWESFKGSIDVCGFGGAWTIESRVFPVAHGFPRALGKRGLSRNEIESFGFQTHVREQLHGYGNAILPQIAEIVWGLVRDVECAVSI
jgi:site-specific DNA-cytosine methylase